MKPSFGTIFWFTVTSFIFLYYNTDLFNKDKKSIMDDIIFDTKSVVLIPHPNNNSILTASGTWTGEGIGYKNNTNRIICYQKDMICTIQSVEQIGEKQISSIAYPTQYSISKWDSDTIISSIDDKINCHKSTISILQKIKMIILTDEYFEYDNDQCKSADRKSYKWTLEDSLFWQKMKK
jgi:hypothetical protein